jgi:hypothetical protein
VAAVRTEAALVLWWALCACSFLFLLLFLLSLFIFPFPFSFSFFLLPFSFALFAWAEVRRCLFVLGLGRKKKSGVRLAGALLGGRPFVPTALFRCSIVLVFCLSAFVGVILLGISVFKLGARCFSSALGVSAARGLFYL